MSLLPVLTSSDERRRPCPPLLRCLPGNPPPPNPHPPCHVPAARRGLIAGRVVVGLGIGISAAVVPAYLGEVAPASGAPQQLHWAGRSMGWLLAVIAKLLPSSSAQHPLLLCMLPRPPACCRHAPAVRGRVVESYEILLCAGMLAASLGDAAFQVRAVSCTHLEGCSSWQLCEARLKRLVFPDHTHACNMHNSPRPSLSCYVPQGLPANWRWMVGAPVVPALLLSCEPLMCSKSQLQLLVVAVWVGLGWLAAQCGARQPTAMAAPSSCAAPANHSALLPPLPLTRSLHVPATRVPPMAGHSWPAG